jgi:hypothetical protein
VSAADDPTIDYRDAEVAYWRARAEAAEDRIRQAAGFYPDTPPEPPVGTEYLWADSGRVGWRRTDNGWYCARIDCFACPAEWGDVWDAHLSRGGYTRRLPDLPDRDDVSPGRDRQP